jgi:hypothetical protein
LFIRLRPERYIDYLEKSELISYLQVELTATPHLFTKTYMEVLHRLNFVDYGTIRKLIAFVSILFFTQYLLGMGINLFAAIPQQTAFNFFGYAGGVEVLAHIVTGALILVVALAILSSSIKLNNAVLSTLSLLALALIVGAIGDGTFFMLLGQQNTYSMAMAIGFVSAFIVYFFEVMEVERPQTAENFERVDIT